MSSWSAVVDAAPDFAGRVQRVFDGRRHKTIATVRRDGSPRVSGIECEFAGGEIVLGMMAASVKLADVRRDPRVALHGMSDDPPRDDPGAWAGDAKIGGRLVEAPDPERKEEPAARFRLEIDEVVLTWLDEPADHLVIESWHPDTGLRVLRRR